MVWLSSSHHLIPFTVSFPKMCNSWHSFSHLLFIVPPYQRELRHFGPKYLVVGSGGASKIFFSYSTIKFEPSPPKKIHIHAHPFYLLKLGQIPGLMVSWGDHLVLRPLEKCGKCIVRPLGGGPHNFRPGGISIVRPLLLIMVIRAPQTR